MMSTVLGVLVLFAHLVWGQCSVNTAPKLATVVRPGYAADLVSTGLESPRGIIFDRTGRLLVVEQGSGIRSIVYTNDTCATQVNSTVIVSDSSLNHGIEFSPDGRVLYASSSNTTWSWDYAVANGTVSNRVQIVTNMANSDHSTRTLLIPPFNASLLIISRGSNSNLDLEAAQISSGRSQVKVFDLTRVPEGGYNFVTQGGLLGWGLRNAVGITVDRQGHVWEVENSADNLERTENGTETDVHMDNPAEELNYCEL